MQEAAGCTSYLHGNTTTTKSTKHGVVWTYSIEHHSFPQSLPHNPAFPIKCQLLSWGLSNLHCAPLVATPCTGTTPKLCALSFLGLLWLSLLVRVHFTLHAKKLLEAWEWGYALPTHELPEDIEQLRQNCLLPYVPDWPPSWVEGSQIMKHMRT